MNTMNIKSSSTPKNINIFFNIDLNLEDIIERIEYILQNGSNAVGVQRQLDDIIPEIESLLKELKEKIKQEKEEKEDDSKH